MYHRGISDPIIILAASRSGTTTTSSSVSFAHSPSDWCSFSSLDSRDQRSDSCQVKIGQCWSTLSQIIRERNFRSSGKRLSLSNSFLSFRRSFVGEHWLDQRRDQSKNDTHVRTTLLQMIRMVTIDSFFFSLAGIWVVNSCTVKQVFEVEWNIAGRYSKSIEIVCRKWGWRGKTVQERRGQRDFSQNTPPWCAGGR